jgi:YVTN family beta-propeller protein
VADVVDGTVTQIDVATLKVVATIPVKATPRMLATFGTVEGPSYQVGPVH